MLVILFISVFLSTLTFVSNQFLSIYHIHSLGHIFTYISNWSLYKFLAPLPGIGAFHFLSLEVDILKNG